MRVSPTKHASFNKRLLSLPEVVDNLIGKRGRRRTFTCSCGKRASEM